ncbi:MAG: hypothetical protein WBF58_10840 [Xanthobacteraceae bacterium]
MFLIVGACLHRTVLWVSALAVGFLVELIAMILWAPTVAALVNSRSTIAWFSPEAVPGGALLLREIPAEKLSTCIPPVFAYQLQSKYKYEYLNTRLGRRLAGLAPQFLPLRVFIVETNILASIRSYGSLRSTSFIFFTDDPSSWVTMDRFKFYHELAHTSYNGCIAFARRYSKTFSFLLAAVVIAAMTPLSLPLIAVIAFLAGRAWWSWAGTPIDCEMHADTSALGALGDPADAEQIVGVFRAVWREDPVRLYADYGRRAMMERDFRIWSMEAALRNMKHAGGTEAKITPTPGRDRIPLMLATYLAAGWAAWHSVDNAGPGLAIVLAALFTLLLTFPSFARLLFASERALERAVEQRIQPPA